MQVLSLFDGISCGQVALHRAGLQPSVYMASEIEPSAIACANQNFPQTMQLGDVVKVRQLAEIGVFGSGHLDLLIGGSPCQGFSTGGAGLNFNDPRSALFFEFVRIKNAIKPRWFLLENVKMRKEWQDRKISLTSILDQGWYSDQFKSYCIDANYGKGTNFKRYFFRGSRQIVFRKGFKIPSMTEDNANFIQTLCKDQWRKLSVFECERLQTLPNGYTRNLRDYDAYHAIGNGWTVDVIAHIFAGLHNAT